MHRRTARKAPPPGKVKYLDEDQVINHLSFVEGPKHVVTTFPPTRMAIPESSTLSTQAFARREKTPELREERGGQRRRQVEPKVKVAKADCDADMDVGDEEEAEGDDGGMSVDATLSTHAFARREKTAKLHEEWGHWQRQVEPQVEEAKVDRDADMDVGNEEEAEGNDGGMSVDATLSTHAFARREKTAKL
ncbi:hypothetical protein L195_g057638, partial [Trifolium pratense]